MLGNISMSNSQSDQSIFYVIYQNRMPWQYSILSYKTLKEY